MENTVAPKYPVRLRDHSRVLVIRLPKNMGGSAKMFVRDVAKNHVKALYFAKIQCDIQGKSNTGKAIPINTVGKWLFGMPGYMGHVRVSNWDGRDAKVEFPQASPPEVIQLLEATKREIESLK